MRVVSWNCQGPPHVKNVDIARSWFREAFLQVAPLKADVAVLQEVANPGVSAFQGRWIFWHGRTLARGVAIILDQARFPNARLIEATRSSVLVDTGAPHHFLVLGLWSRPEKPSLKNYLIETKAVLEHHREHLLSTPTVIVGSLNSNAYWDSKTRHFSHSQLVELMATDFGLHSAYHNQHLVTPGQETDPTFFPRARRKRSSSSHVDYGFLPGHWLLEGVTVGEAWEEGEVWEERLIDSEHRPLIIDCLCSDTAAWPDVPRSEDVMIGIRIGDAISFHLQSESRGWSHGYDAALDLMNLNDSLNWSGVHDILTCACGLSGCRCGSPRPRGVDVSLLADGDALWRDRDRDVRYRLSRHRIRHQMLELEERCQAVWQEFAPRSSDSFRIRPARSEMRYSSDLLTSKREYDPPSESGLIALTFFPELPNNALAIEIREFARWAGDQELMPLGTNFIRFAERLLKVLPQILHLPQLERLVLVVAATAVHDLNFYDGWVLYGVEKVRALLGDIDTVWRPLLQARFPHPFDPDDVPTCPEARLPLVGALLRLGELLSGPYSCSPAWMPHRLVRSDGTPHEHELDAILEYWKQAYTSEVVRTVDGQLRLKFVVPAEAAETYIQHLVFPRVRELSQLVEFIRPHFLANGLIVAPLLYSVETSDTTPRMTPVHEALFGIRPDGEGPVSGKGSG